MARRGFRKIDNDIFKALMAASMSGAAFRIVLAVIDKTLGFQEEKAKISLSHFQKVTGLSRQSVRLAVKQAEAKNLITAQRDSTRPTIYALNDWREWLTRQQNHPSELGNKITLDWETLSPQLGKQNHPSTRKPATSETTMPKETIKETIKESKGTYGEFQNVLLTDGDYQKLKDRLNTRADEFIERLSAYMKSTGKRYKDHYATILNWQRREQEGKDGKAKDRGFPKDYTPTADYPDL